MDQALAIVDAANRDEQAGRATAAESGYRKALSIDAGVPGAQEGLDRLTAGRSADVFSVAMSRGFAESAAGQRTVPTTPPTTLPDSASSESRAREASRSREREGR